MSKRSSWIISPLGDLLFLIATPLAILPLVPALARYWLTPEQIALLVASFASLGHHLPGFMRAYGDRSLFQRFRWRFLLAPPLIFAAALAFAWNDLHGFALLLLFWSTWHGLMQTYGFMRIYELKRGMRDNSVARLDLALCLGLFIAGFVFSDARMYGVAEVLWQTGLPALDAAAVNLIRWSVGISVAIVLIAYVVNQLRAPLRAAGLCGTKLLLAATTAWLYWTSGVISTNILVGVAMFEIFHAIQYYAIVWAYNRKLAERASQEFGPLGFLFRDRWIYLGLYLAAIGAFGCIRFFGGSVQDPLLQKLLLAGLATSTFLHFYYDGFIWKVSEPETSRNLDIAESERTPRWRSHPAVRHLSKWAVLGLLLVGLAAIELREGKGESGESHLLAALDEWSGDLPEVQMRLADQALERGDVSAAIGYAKEAVESRPRSHLAHAILGKAHLAAEAYPAALVSLRQSASLAADPLPLQADIAFALQNTGQQDEARGVLARALEQQPQDADLLLQWARWLAADQQADAALEVYDKLLRRGHRGLAASCEKALLLLRQDRLDEALKEAQQAQRRYPQAALAHLTAGRVWMARRQFPEAARDLGTAATKNPRRFESWLLLGTARLHIDRLPAAESALQKALALNPNHPLVHLQLGNVRFLQERYEPAAQCYQTSLQLEPHADAWNGLGGVRVAQEQWPAAETAFKRAIELDADHLRACVNLAQLMELLDRHGEASQWKQRAAELTELAAGPGD